MLNIHHAPVFWPQVGRLMGAESVNNIEYSYKQREQYGEEGKFVIMTIKRQIAILHS